MGDVLIRTLAGLVMALALPATPAFAYSGSSVPGGHAFTEPVVQTSASPEIALPEIPRAVGLSASDVPVVAGPGTAAPVPQGSETAKARGSGEAGDEVAFTIPDPRITESSGLALSPTHDGVVYTHNDSDAGPTFFALGPKGATRATFTLRGAQARDWEAMAASKDPETGRGVLWFADIGDNFDGAWPDISIYKVMEPATVRDAVLPAVRYRFRYEDGGHNAEGIMVNPKTGRLYVVTKQFAGAIYAAPRRLSASRTNVLRKVGSAPIMATDAAYAPDGSSFVVRTYFSATVYKALDKPLTRVPMPALDQAESIAYTGDGKALLVGSEGANSPVYRVPLPENALPTPTPTPTPTPSTPEPLLEAADGETVAADSPGGITGTDVLLWLAVATGATGVITIIARKSR
ncbi:hypothetical protein GCM10010412_084790 [Nonomuraea recticatena]|uniref:Esterase-like activity of phytase family protein n=2 Tax=Nonomuraea recticatena TaxID=46178 RepID=A0ABN3T7E3_9ACTN